jgi:hypothetical protein
MHNSKSISLVGLNVYKNVGQQVYLGFACGFIQYCSCPILSKRFHIYSFIKNSINYEVVAVDNLINSTGEVAFEVQAIKIHLTGAPLVLVNVYLRGADQLSLSKRNEIIT